MSRRATPAVIRTELGPGVLAAPRRALGGGDRPGTRPATCRRSGRRSGRTSAGSAGRTAPGPASASTRSWPDADRPGALAADHRGVAEAVRSGWADAGVCLRLVSEEAGLDFLGVRQEAYDLCFPTRWEGDPRLQALVQAVRSPAYRRSLGELPGYDSTAAGGVAPSELKSGEDRKPLARSRLVDHHLGRLDDRLDRVPAFRPSASAEPRVMAPPVRRCRRS